MLVRAVMQDATGMSRRQCFGLFRNGNVMLNDVVCESFGSTCQVGDVVARDDGSQHSVIAHNLSEKQSNMILFHKPVGCVVSRYDRFNKTIYDVLPTMLYKHYRPVGRLDKDTSGLLLLTNDGAFSHAITHPASHVAKVYRVVIDRPFASEDISRVLDGEVVGMFDPYNGHTDFLSFNHVLLEDRETLRITLTEGKNRHIRRLLRHLGYHVCALERIAIGGVSLQGLQSGSYRFLVSKELLLLTDGFTYATQTA